MKKVTASKTDSFNIFVIDHDEHRIIVQLQRRQNRQGNVKNTIRHTFWKGGNIELFGRLSEELKTGQYAQTFLDNAPHEYPLFAKKLKSTITGVIFTETITFPGNLGSKDPGFAPGIILSPE